MKHYGTLGGNATDIHIALSGEESTATPRRKRAGRHQFIDDGRLEGSRDYLVWLVESTWGDVGSKLRSIKTTSDVQRALAGWEQYREHNHVVRVLLRTSTEPATSKKLANLRRRLEQLNVLTTAAGEFQEKCRESLTRAERALVGQWSEGQRQIIQEKRDERSAAFARAEAEYLVLNARREKLEQTLRKCEAYFALTEFARFCKSRRYSLTPLNTANALAGLPYIGWRQSVKRCGPRKCASADGYTYQLFKVFCDIVKSSRRRGELVKHAGLWLRAHSRAKSHAIEDLRTNWYYARRSIQDVLKMNVLSRELPYALLREYLKQKSQPSAVDLLFAEEERITD